LPYPNFDEDELNSLGYKLMRANKLKEATGIFLLNVEGFPQSSNAYDSLAEAFEQGGDRSQAIASYQRALELNPNNRNAMQGLQRLKGR